MLFDVIAFTTKNIKQTPEKNTVIVLSNLIPANNSIADKIKKKATAAYFPNTRIHAEDINSNPVAAITNFKIDISTIWLFIVLIFLLFS